MGRTRIEWLRDPTTGEAGFSINPVKGLCPVDCKDNQGKSYCYARAMYKRFKWNPEIRWDFSPMLDVFGIDKPSRIFVGSTMELFGDWVKPAWLTTLFRAVESNPAHTFIFLTKRPGNLIKWSPFPRNAYVGVSVTTNGDMTLALTNLAHIQAKVKFISFEPLLGMIGMDDHMPLEMASISWVIIGQQTPVKKATRPKSEWIQEIVEAADKVGIPIFLKNNLYPLIGLGNGQPSLFHKNEIGELRQEFPNG